ncbi:unnamed protein product [Chrysodeixis includens]|uniref:Uncharacterized protein n=1 Tax=Chrysodeixis includens TaxID=689277 RepID=A0A9P0BU50_CHRIL|nr:unnamed protein product [Chrysodeixis includens]
MCCDVCRQELLEEVEQDEQACEAAARSWSGARGGAARGGARCRLNSLQDLVAALAAEPAPRRHHVRHHAPAPAVSNVSARAIHGGSLPSGVDTSSLLSEEPARGAGYLATVRCVNPPPLAERRVSASDANTPAEMELLNRRSKPMFPMTYTARATLEIGSGSVCSGRAVTTTTASNQVAHDTRRDPALLYGHLLPKNQRNQPKTTPEIPQSEKLMNALRPKKNDLEDGSLEAHLKVYDINASNRYISEPHNPTYSHVNVDTMEETSLHRVPRNDHDLSVNTISKPNYENYSQLWTNHVDNWYRGLADQRVYYADIVRMQNQHTNVVNQNMNSIIRTTILNNSTPVLSFERYQVDNIIPQHIVSYQPRANVVEENNHYFSNTRNQDNGLRGIIKNDRYDQYNRYDNDIILRKQYRKQKSSNLAVPTLSQINPRNWRPMTIGSPERRARQILSRTETTNKTKLNEDKGQHKVIVEQSTEVPPTSNDVTECVGDTTKDISSRFNTEPSILKYTDTIEENNKYSLSVTNVNFSNSIEKTEVTDTNNGIELTEFKSSKLENVTKNKFADFFASQEELLKSLDNVEEFEETIEIKTCRGIDSIPEEIITTDEYIDSIPEEIITTNDYIEETPEDISYHVYDVVDVDVSVIKEWVDTSVENNDLITGSEEIADDDGTITERMLAEIPNNSFIFLTVPQPLIYPVNTDNTDNTKSTFDNNNNDSTPILINEEKEQPFECPVNTDTKKKTIIDKNALKVLLLQNLLKNNVIENPSGDAGVSAITGEEVDSAISFSCITTPEVVASCNTTSSSAQSAVAVDPKPRSMISSSFNGLPLSRPNYGSTGSSATDDYKKSLDENGNSVQGFSSPLSGSSQHKKPRRKKSSKNETVIDCQQIDGYQGDKDVNELLRFIESNADNGRAPKLGRVKHKDDSEDKSGKKRSTERRKDKENKIKRASSLEELSRTKIEDLTDVAESPLRGDKKDRRGDHPPAKAERRSWGEDARDALAFTELPQDSPVAAAELTDFQTVTKKRKPRRRPDEPDREPAPRRARPPLPARAASPRRPPTAATTPTTTWTPCTPCPPRPAPPRPPRRPAARLLRGDRAHATQHPRPYRVLQFLREGAAAPPATRPGERRPSGGAAAGARTATRAGASRRRRRDLKPALLRRERKPAPPPHEAPDVVADRRPPVILLDSAARPRDMDGVTFGFDINEQLLSTGARRPRCDLLRDAPSPACACGRRAPRCATCRPSRRPTRTRCCSWWTTWARVSVREPRAPPSALAAHESFCFSVGGRGALRRRQGALFQRVARGPLVACLSAAGLVREFFVGRTRHSGSIDTESILAGDWIYNVLIIAFCPRDEISKDLEGGDDIVRVASSMPCGVSADMAGEASLSLGVL